jgi:phosphoglycolate phosphatase
MTTSILNRPAGAVVFDLDGTLVDSLPDLLWTTNTLLDELGRPPVSAAAVRRWIGDGAAVLVQRALAATGGAPDIPSADLLGRFLALYGTHLAVDSRPFPGAADAMRALRQAGHLLGVCTNKPTDLAVALLASLDLLPAFGAVIGGDGVSARKPHPDHLLATLAAMGAGDRRAVMVGDGANDVAAARGAEIPVVVVGFGYSMVEPRALGGDAVIDSFAELPAVVARIL